VIFHFILYSPSRFAQGLELTNRHIRQLAENHNVPMPTMDVAHQHMLSARAHGGDQMDWTALVGGERISAGLKPFGSRVCLLYLFPPLLSTPVPHFPLFLPNSGPSSVPSLDSSLTASFREFGKSSALLIIRSDSNDMRDKY
jgi:hypothetical protein